MLEDSETCMAVQLSLALEQLAVLTDSLETLMDFSAKLSEDEMENADSVQVSISLAVIWSEPLGQLKYHAQFNFFHPVKIEFHKVKMFYVKVSENLCFYAGVATCCNGELTLSGFQYSVQFFTGER